jgi:hypothetical protein
VAANTPRGAEPGPKGRRIRIPVPKRRESTTLFRVRAIISRALTIEDLPMPKRSCRLGIARLFVVLCSAGLAAPVMAAEEGWQFDLAIYGWLPNIDVELPGGTKTKITQSDIVNNLDMAFMGTAQLRKDRWSLRTDVNYFDLQHKDRSPLGQRLNLRKITLQAALIKPTIGYRLLESPKNVVEIYAGGRYFWIEPTLEIERTDLDPPTTSQGSQSDSLWDALVGLRGEHALNERWFIPYFADVGTGDSDSVIDLFGGVGYRFNRLDAIAAWRYLDYDFGNDIALDTMTINGPLVGVRFAF